MVEVLLIDVRQATPVRARVRAVDSEPFILISAEHMLRLQRLSSSLPSASHTTHLYTTLVVSQGFRHVHHRNIAASQPPWPFLTAFG